MYIHLYEITSLESIANYVKAKRKCKNKTSDFSIKNNVFRLSNTLVLYCLHHSFSFSLTFNAVTVINVIYSIWLELQLSIQLSSCFFVDYIKMLHVCKNKKKTSSSKVRFFRLFSNFQVTWKMYTGENNANSISLSKFIK